MVASLLAWSSPLGVRHTVAGLAFSSLMLVVVGCRQVPDLAAERMALRGADSLFGVETEARGADGWADFFLASGVMIPQHGRVDGREAIRDSMVPAFAPGQPRLRWRTTDVQVGAGGDLGYTLGRWQSVGTTATDEDTVLNEGHYVTIWRKTADGVWRVAVDIGNNDENKGTVAGQ